MAEPDEVLGGRTRAALVVDLDRRQVGQRARVDHHQRQPGGPQLLDLRVVRRQADHDNAVHRRPAHRAGERPLQRRDEVQGVALVLGRQRDALRECPEERVGEDHRQRLRGEHAEGARRSLGQHPGDRVGPVAEGVRDRANADRRLGREPAGPVEGERDRGLRDARLAGDVGDARTAPGPLLHGHLGVRRPDRRPTAGGRITGPARGRHLRAPDRSVNRFSKPV